MKELQTIRGETFIVDDEDYEKAKQYRWTVRVDEGRPRILTTSKGYSGSSYKKLILGLRGKFTLFKNDNYLDLRKENIMVFDTRSEYGRVAGKRFYKPVKEPLSRSRSFQKIVKTSKKTKYMGLHYASSNPRPWLAVLVHNREHYYLGSYTKEEYAAWAYDKKILELYGTDSRRNFPDLTIKELADKLDGIKEKEDAISYNSLSKKNQGKRPPNISKTSQYVGVSRNKQVKRGRIWVAYLWHHAKRYYLGSFYTEEAAARAYDAKAIELFGENAKLNFPQNNKK